MIRELHARVGRAASPLGDSVVDVLRGVLDVTCFAVQAVLGIDL